MSPLLFNIYINDLLVAFRNIPLSRSMGYADDLAAICADEVTVATLINTIQKWSRDNRVGINK